MHGTQKIGDFWRYIEGFEHRQYCRTCHTTESMNHIPIDCNESVVTIAWNLARNTWLHEEFQWPEISVEMILGCGSLATLQTCPRRNGDHQRHPPNLQGAIRLLQILITETAHLIWVIKCERAIQRRGHNNQEITTRWYQVINRRLTEDKITAVKIKRDMQTSQKFKHTWKATLRKQTGSLSKDWIHNREVLVGRREHGAGPTQDPNPEPHTIPTPGMCITFAFLPPPGPPWSGYNTLDEADGKSSKRLALNLSYISCMSKNKVF
jgi:hypothetical protein